MKKSKIENVYIHSSDLALTEFESKVNKAYADIIERCLGVSGLSKEERVKLIDRLIAAYGK